MTETTHSATATGPEQERDQETARLLRRGDPEGLRRLLRDHGGKARGALRREFSKVLDMLEIDEAISQASHSVWRTSDRFDPSRTPLGVWFYVIARNCARRIIDCKRRQAALPLHEEIDSLAGAPAPAPDFDGSVGAARQAFIDAVHRCIDRLPPQQRAVLRADLLAGGSADTAELARELGTTRNSVYVSRTNGRKALRALMVELGDQAPPLPAPPPSPPPSPPHAGTSP